MQSVLSVISPSVTEPVAIDVLRQHCRIDHTADDNLLAIYAQSARMLAELYLSRAIAVQQYRWVVSRTPPPISYPYVGLPASLIVFPLWFSWQEVGQRPLELPRQPVISVDAIGTGLWGQDDTPLVANVDYNADPSSGRLRFIGANKGGLGYLFSAQDHVTVDFTAGYAVVPTPIRNAIMLTTAFLYEQRGDASAEMPTAATQLLTPYRLVSFG